MSEVRAERVAWWRTGRGQSNAVIALLVVIAIALVVAGQVRAARERSLRVDELYCTLSGVSVYDQAPNSGRLCGDVLRSAG